MKESFAPNIPQALREKVNPLAERVRHRLNPIEMVTNEILQQQARDLEEGLGMQSEQLTPLQATHLSTIVAMLADTEAPAESARPIIYLHKTVAPPELRRKNGGQRNFHAFTVVAAEQQEIIEIQEKWVQKNGGWRLVEENNYTDEYTTELQLLQLDWQNNQWVPAQELTGPQVRTGFDIQTIAGAYQFTFDGKKFPTELGLISVTPVHDGDGQFHTELNTTGDQLLEKSCDVGKPHAVLIDPASLLTPAD